MDGRQAKSLSPWGNAAEYREAGHHETRAAWHLPRKSLPLDVRVALCTVEVPLIWSVFKRSASDGQVCAGPADLPTCPDSDISAG